MPEGITRVAVPAYLVAKAGWSLANDLAQWWAPRSFLPPFASPEALWGYLAARYTYTGDPFSGAGDFYLSPYRLAAALAQGAEAARRLSVDCDDVAGLAFVACRSMPGASGVRLVTLYDESGRFGHHVICVGLFQGRPFALDTNGFRWLASLDDAELCAEWSRIYTAQGYRYAAAYTSPYPW